MGDICNMNDLERFLRSPEGKEHLEEIRQLLLGKTVTEVSFNNEVHFIATTLHLNDGETFVVFQPSLEVEAVREQFEAAIEREYYIDFPERKPIDEPNMTADPLVDYIKSKGIHCPYCHDGDIQGEQVEIEGGFASQEMTCLNCDRSWIDTYTLTAVVELQEEGFSGKPEPKPKESAS